MKRVFIGYKCEPLPGLISTTDKLRSKMNNASLKWASPLYWHITSHFIGKAEKGEIEILKDIISETSKSASHFSVSVKGIGFFPSAGHPKVLWAGVEPKDKLSKLYHKTGALLRTAGFKTDDRPYSPHITLARVKHCKNTEITKEIESTYSGTVFGTLNINEIILYESRLFPSGAKYIPLFKAEFNTVD